MREDLATIEQELTRLGQAMAYPPTPELAARVRARITQGVMAPAKPGAWGLAGTAVAGLVVLAAVIVGIAAPAREAVADLFDRIDIFTTDEVPESLTADFRGETVSLDEAQQRLGRPILLPAGPDGSLLVPSAVIYQDYRPARARAVALFFETDDGIPFVVVETDAALGKGLGPGASAQPVAGVGDGEAYWLEGLRIVELYDADGNFIQESQRRTGANTLVWIQDDLVLRLEGDLSQDEALHIARSMR